MYKLYTKYQIRLPLLSKLVEALNKMLRTILKKIMDMNKKLGQKNLPRPCRLIEPPSEA